MLAQPVTFSGTCVFAATVRPDAPAVDVIVQPLGGEIVFCAVAVVVEHVLRLFASHTVTEYLMYVAWVLAGVIAKSFVAEETVTGVGATGVAFPPVRDHVYRRLLGIVPVQLAVTRVGAVGTSNEAVQVKPLAWLGERLMSPPLAVGVRLDEDGHCT